MSKSHSTSKSRSLSFIVIEGKRYPWKDILALRQAQLDAAPGCPAQIPLFSALHEDRRPATACTASRRYLEPGLFAEDEDVTIFL